MDLLDPTRAVTPALDGPVLAVLARTGKPLTVGEIARQATRGSEIGIRRAVTRLVDQGLVISTQMGRNQVHELNRDHVAAPAAVVLADLRLELWRRLRELVGAWSEPAMYACVFGSAARGDGDEASDIDILLVHRPHPEDLDGRGASVPPVRLAETLTGVMAARTPEQAAQWHAQVDDLHVRVQRWTGNVAQVLDLAFHRWRDLEQDEPTLYAAIERDGIKIADASFPTRRMPADAHA